MFVLLKNGRSRSALVTRKTCSEMKFQEDGGAEKRLSWLVQFGEPM